MNDGSGDDFWDVLVSMGLVVVFALAGYLMWRMR